MAQSSAHLMTVHSYLGIEWMTDMEDRWLSVDEIGKYLGVSSDTVYRWIDKNSMPAHRVGRFWKFKKEQVDAWIEAGGAADKPENKDLK